MSAKRSAVIRKASSIARPGPLLADVRHLILSARQQVAQAINAGLTMLYWQIGVRIHRDILKEKRAGYEEQIVSALGRQLEREFGRGFSEKSLHMVRFAEVFPDSRIVSALLRQLSWSHFLSTIYLDDPLKRDFYAEMCRIERWSTRTLDGKEFTRAIQGSPGNSGVLVAGLCPLGQVSWVSY